MSATRFEQMPDFSLPITFRWHTWLASGEVISASSYWMSPASAVALSSFTAQTSFTSAWCQGTIGLAEGAELRLFNRVHSDKGRRQTRSLLIKIVGHIDLAPGVED